MFVCLDIETTGLNPKEDEVIEVAIVRFDHEGIHEEWSTLVHPGVSIPEFTRNLTGIDDEMVKDAPNLEEVMPLIREKVGDLPIMGHFIFFDVNFLNHNGANLKNIQLDSCQLAQVLLHNEPSYSLEVMVQKLGLNQPDAHRALDDVKANIELVHKLFGHFTALSDEKKAALKTVFEKSTWPWAKPLLNRLEVNGGERIQQSPSSRQIDSERHCNLKEATQSLTPPFLLEEESHTILDLIDYAQDLDDACVLSVEDLSLVPDHDELGIIQHPEQYLDEDRLMAFLDKTELDPTATMLGAKLLLWLDHTEHGEKSELRLVKDEKNAWMDVCCQESDTPNSFYKKALDGAESKSIRVISHHHLLKDRSRKDPLLKMPKHLVVAETEKLTKTLEHAWHIRLGESRFLQDILRLKQANPDATEVLDHIASRISILFGFLGMVIQRHGEANDPRHMLVVEAFHRNTTEWNKVQKAAESIRSAVAALGEDLEKSPLLDEFERYLTYLGLILSNPDPVLWLTLSQDDQPIVHSFPDQTAELFEKRVWNGIESLHLFCHRGNLKDDYAFLKSELGLPEDLATHFLEASTCIPMMDAEEVLSSPKDPKNIQEVTQAIVNRLDSAKNIFVLVTSMRVAEDLFYKLNPHIKETERALFVQNMSGGMGKILKLSQKTDGQNVYVGKDYLMDFLINEGVDLELLIVHRLPFSPPSDPIQKSRAKDYGNAYEEFSLPQANLRFQSIVHSFLGNRWEDKQILMCDTRKNLLL